ncbi:DNA polymerase III subunit gamma and tau [Phytohabitans sp. ZYX-F-186]|uniref:DNA-directed DNA polymerase n=1 Tax=Phytohabitans maris TaxID=3071409 RepID=A0ABU0ZKU0_9ACTN|nr:DNA polymerase III subunit gamma and tau [Phytohabitans sp. ZYX-F-186]MDQ7906875.1 DNA polymerase III subunit gamma and tau [Phytohabitans sp. ZYX-F-186]
MALALYRKYRPRTFAEVIGQEHVTEPLSQALRSGRLHHAYLFSGPRGCGKTSSARILARSLNCAQGPTPEPCGQCDSCKSLANDGAGSIDVIEIDAASHGGVDDARELRERAFFAPATSRYKIYVIDEAHMVSSAGFNALLKLVEEPPEYVKFIFATTEPEKVLGTIKSRTHHYPFRLIPPGVLRPYLEQLCATEGVKVESAVFPLVVRAGGGSARDTLSVLDQLIAGAGPEGVTYARAVALLGVTDVALIDEMCDALAAGDGAAAYGTIDRVADAGHDPRRFASDLLERLRDLIVLQQVPDAATKGLIDGPSDQIERMVAQSARLGPATLSRCADIVHNGLVEMRGTTAPRLLLELITARMLLPGSDQTEDLLQRLERMERQIATGATQGASSARHATGAGHAAGVTQGASSAGHATGAAPGTTSAGHATASGHAAGAAQGTSGGQEPSGGNATSSGHAASGGGAQGASGAHTTNGQATGATSGQATSATSDDEPHRAVQPQADARLRAAVMDDPATPEPERPGTSLPPQLDVAGVRRSWDEILRMVNDRNKRIAALARNATVRDLDGDALVLTFQSSVLASMMAKEAGVLSDAVYDVLGARWEVRCEVSGDQRPAAAAAARATRAPEGRATPAPEGRAAQAADRGATRGPDGPAAAERRPGQATERQAAPGRAGPERGAPEQKAPVTTDWPEPARPGGGTASADPKSGNADAKSGNAPEAPPPVARVESNGLAAARAAAAGRGARTPASSPTADSTWAGEPPYDPDYDGPRSNGAVASPATTAVAYEGFDPGDEPTDEVVDERTARQSSEQQAMQLLQQTFGAEKIGEV